MKQQEIRRLTTIMSADVVGFSRLMHSNESATLASLRAHRTELIDPAVKRHAGRIIKLMGDGAIIEFPSVVEAVLCAEEIQNGVLLRNADLAKNEAIRFRIGINIGDVIVDGDDIYGDGVNLSDRLQGLAEPGGICISEAVREQIRDKLDLEFTDLGQVTVKNIPRPVRAFHFATEPSGRKASHGGYNKLTKWIIAAAAIVIMIAVAIYGLVVRIPSSAPTTTLVEPLPPELPVLAVLPFANMSGDEDQDYVSDGITADLINDFSRISGLMVIARNTMFTYKNTAVSVRDVGRELNADHVLEGSVRKIGNRVRVNVQLIEAETERELWADRFDREIADIFALQDEITSQIVSTLSVRLTGKEKVELEVAQQANPEAYDLLLRALANYRRYTRENNEEARALAQRAIAVDPGFARAYVVLALTHYMDALFNWQPVEEATALAEETAQLALSLDDELPQVHFALADVNRIRGRYDEAIAAANRAVELDPGYADGYAVLGLTLLYSGQPEQGLQATQRAIQINPRSPFFYIQNVGLAHYLMGDYEKAASAFEEVIDRNPEFLLGHVMLAASYAQLGQAEDALWEKEEVLLLQPKFSLDKERETSQFRKKEDLEHYLEGLRLAGFND